MRPHKITNEVDGQLRAVAKELPEIVKLGPDGKPETFIRYKTTHWEDLPEGIKKQIPKKEFKRKRGKLTDEPVTYRIPYRCNRVLNHYDQLVKAYKSKGEDGVAQYVDTINEVTQASKAAAAQIGQDKENTPAEGAPANG